MKTRIIITLLFLIVVPPLLSQSYEDNLEKYWYFRNQLKEKFMYFNEDASVPGAHHVAENRYEPEGGWDYYIRWGDGVWWLGHYIGVLALEYQLLAMNGQDVNETLDELNWAFDTYYRLDFNAEPCFNDIFGNPGNESINGFFLRDDLDTDCSAYFDGLDIKSDYIDNCQNGEEKNCNSQDQCISMFLGLSLVNELVDNDIIQERSDEIAELVIGSMNWFDPAVLHFVWEIRNPVTGGVPPGGQIIELWSYCWAEAEAAGFITGNNEHRGYSFLNKQQFDIAQGLVHEMLQGGNPILDKFEGYFTMVLSAIVNDGGNYFNPESDGDSYEWLYDLYDLTKAYEDMGEGVGLFPHLPAISEILHGYEGDNQMPTSIFEDDFLNPAPPCGSFNYPPEFGGDSEPPWHTLSLFCPWHRSLYGLHFPGKYNMLDYMMLFNAYFYIYHKNCLRVSVNSNGTCPELEILPPPHEPRWWYTIEDPKIVRAVKTIKAYDIINEGGGIIYEAGESVQLKPGFKASSGSSVKVTIDPSMLLLPYYAKTNVDPCNGGTFETLTINYKSADFNNIELLKTTYNESITEPNYKNILNSSNNSDYHQKFTVENREDISTLKAYPNPTNGKFNIDLPRYNGNLTLEIYDYTGLMIFSSISEIYYNFNFDLSEYKSGLYLVKIKLGPYEKIIKVSKI